MAVKYFNEEHAQSPERKSHMAVMDGDSPVNLPIVKGVVSIPDPLHGKIVLPAGWVKYTGQVPSSAEELQPIDDINVYYRAEKDKKKAP